MNATLASFQDGFARALAAPQESPAPEVAKLTGQPGFAVHRNTVTRACIDALQANYPAVTRLVGEDWFRAAAAVFAREHLPALPTLLSYGEGFDAFLRQFEPATHLPYLPGVARLDRCWIESHSARDAATADPAVLKRFAPEALAQARLRPHPAARWAWFEGIPIYSIWSHNREQLEETSGLDWHGEGALLTRPGEFVLWRGLDSGGCAFLDACARGSTLAEAAAAALSVQTNVDLAVMLASLLEAGALADSGGDAADKKQFE